MSGCTGLFVLVMVVLVPFLFVWQCQMFSDAIDLTITELLIKLLWGLVESLVLNVENIDMRICTRSGTEDLDSSHT